MDRQGKKIMELCREVILTFCQGKFDSIFVSPHLGLSITGLSVFRSVSDERGKTSLPSMAFGKRLIANTLKNNFKPYQRDLNFKRPGMNLTYEEDNFSLSDRLPNRLFASKSTSFTAVNLAIRIFLLMETGEKLTYLAYHFHFASELMAMAMKSPLPSDQAIDSHSMMVWSNHA